MAGGFLIFCCLYFIYFLPVSNCEDPVVVLSTGKVRGQVLQSAANRTYYSFKGIPYAAPPVGYYRFRAPQPPKQWNTTLNGTLEPPACCQPWTEDFPYPQKTSEDCLYVNVFTPHLQRSSDDLLPVMVLIHGGRQFRSSSSTDEYGPDFLINENVVVVSFNYRLGIFGHLNLKTRSAQGNAAFKDQIAALRWVQLEISYFGGNPNSVTIFGQGSGAEDVSYLYISPMAQGLFHRAISQSGMSNWMTNSTYNHRLSTKLARKVGCPQTDTEDAVACLRDITAEVLAQKQQEAFPITDNLKIVKMGNPFAPTIEERFGEDVFLSSPLETLLHRSQSNVPYMMGLNSDEGLMFLEDPINFPFQFHDFKRELRSYLPHSIVDHSSHKTVDIALKLLKDFYFGEHGMSSESVTGFMHFLMDRVMLYYMSLTARTLSVHSPVYLYYFTFDGSFRHQRVHSFPYNVSGVDHGDELGYVFYRPHYIPAQTNKTGFDQEWHVQYHMVKLWTNFAKHGNPTQGDQTLGVDWLPVNSTHTRHLVINSTLNMVTSTLLERRLAIWETVFELAESEHEYEVAIGITIITLIMGLGFLCLMYLLYTSSCTNRKEYTPF